MGTGTAIKSIMRLIKKYYEKNYSKFIFVVTPKSWTICRVDFFHSIFMSLVTDFHEIQ